MTLIAGLAFTAAKKPEQPPVSTAGTSGGKHFLWRVSDAPAPFYILGSFHALRATDYPLGAAIDEAISQSRRFVFEIDPEHLDYAAYNRKLRDAAQYPSGTTLRQKVTPKTFELIKKIARTRSSSYDTTKPWAIGMFMYGHPDVHDIFGHWGIESYIQRKAGGTASYGGLESPDEHIRVLSDMGDMESEIFLLQSMAYGDRHIHQFGAAVAAWKRGDVHAVARMDSQEERQAPYIVQRLITKRNAAWIPRIEAEMKTGTPTMIVVGARHLCGPYSVIDLMTRQGHKLEQL